MNKTQNVVLVCNLKAILQQKNMSANYLANTIEERRSTINDLINNNDMDKRLIPARLIAKLCFFLNVTPSDLFDFRKVTIPNIIAGESKGYS